MSIVYLTGMPSTGKSSVTSRIAMLAPDIEIICYSDVLKRYLKQIKRVDYTTQELREKSSHIIFPSHITSLDTLVAQQIEESTAAHIILESHAITVEDYGYRATPFSIKTLNRIRPDLIIVLYDKPQQIQSRILQDAQGRPLRDVEDIAYGQFLQASLALQYGVLRGAEIHFLNGCQDADSIAKWLLDKINY